MHSSKSPNSRRSVMNQMTIAQLKALAKKHKVYIPAKATKTGIGSRLMQSLSAEQIRAASRKSKAKSSRSRSGSKTKSRTSRSASPCRRGTTVTRKAYTRADGTRVRAVTYCRKK